MGQLNVSNITANNIDVNQSLDVNQITSTVSLTAVSASQRPTGVAAGTIIWNTDTLEVEVWNGSDWVNVAKKSGGALPTDGMRVYLDATNTDSYPGSGTTWTDLSGYGNNFQIVNGAFKGGAGSMTGYMDFQGNHGQAKNGGDISLSGDVSYVCVTRIKNSTGQWRTLTRSYNADHHVIVQSGAWNIGMYDNNGAGFIGTGYSQQSLPGYASNSFMVMVWRWSNNDNPTYELHVDGISRGSISNSNARYNRGFGSIGGYHSGNTNPSSGSQWWGDIRLFAAYARRLSTSEIAEIQNAMTNQGYI
jgi:hypothetical protein|tara:strand:- start:119 stop:1030 length:912 start_codon:yes stop_codon:yes gene_type:complete